MQTKQSPIAAKKRKTTLSEASLENRRPRLLPLGAALMAASLNAGAQQVAAEDAEKVLSTVRVQADMDVPQDGYRASTTRVGKTLQDPHDIPQAITTVTSKIMEEQQVGSLREAMRNVSGVSFNAAEGGRSGDNMMLRGFYTFGDMYLDGIRDTAQYDRETFNLEQVDVLRGAGAMLFGRGQAGGVINMVSKTPMLTDRHKASLSVGTDDYLEGSGDFNKRLGESTALRINVMHRDEGSWRSNPNTGTEPKIRREGLAVSLGTGLYTDNEFILSHVRTTGDDIMDYGISFDGTTRKPGKVLPSKYFWGIGKNFDKSETNITTGTYTHRFSPTSEWRTQLRYADYERSYWALKPSLTTPQNPQGTVTGGVTRAMDYETLTLQSDFNRKFRTGTMQHEFLAGVEYLREDSSRKGLQNFGGSTVANPPIYRPYKKAVAGNPVKFTSDSYAIYVQDTVEFIPQWKATLGLRKDWMDADYANATSPKLKYNEMSTRAALSYHPSDETHYYLGFSDSFSPTADLYQLHVKAMPAERSRVLELGSKWMLMDGDLALRAALYRAEKKWERNTDLEATASILTKKRRTDGFELEAAGRVTDNWEVFAGLALMDAKILAVAENVNATTGAITSANPAYKGKRARNTPKQTFNLWSTYKLGGGWKVGGGVEAKGDRYAYNPSGTGPIPTLPGGTKFHPNQVPSYTRWDAMLAYEQKDWGVRLNVQNLFDKLYFDSVYDNGGFTVPGTKRKFILTGEYKF